MAEPYTYNPTGSQFADKKVGFIEYQGREPQPYKEERPQLPKIEYGYWENPKNIAMHYSAQRAAPPGMDMGQYGWDPDFVNEAFDYMTDANQGAPWWEWKALPYGDPFLSRLQAQQAPPRAAQYQPGKVYEWALPTEEQPAQPFTTAEPLGEGEVPPFPEIGTPEYDELPSWQKIVYGAQSSGALRGAFTMLPYAGFIALTGGLAALPTMLGAGAVLGWANDPEKFKWMKAQGGWRELAASAAEPLSEKVFAALNWFTEQTEAGTGLAAQIGQYYSWPAYKAVMQTSKALDANWNTAKLAEYATRDLTGLADVLSHTEEAYNAGRLAYEAAGLTRMGWVLGNIPAAIEWTVDNLAGLIISPEHQPGTDVIFAGPGEVWQLGQKSPVKIDKSAMGIINTARQELVDNPGMDWHEVVQKYQTQLGFTGQFTDLVAQSLADPLNVAGSIEAKGLLIFGKSIKNPILVKAAEQAFHQGQGLIGARRIYRVMLPAEVPTWKMTPGQLKLTGINTEGQYETLTPTRTVKSTGRKIGTAFLEFGENPFSPQAWVGFFRNLFDLTPDSRYKMLIEMTHDTTGLALEMGKNDPKEMYRVARALKELDVREAAGVAEILGMPEAQTIKQGFTGVDVDGLEKAWDMGERPRRILDNIAAALGETRGKVLDKIHDASKGDTKWADNLATRIKKQAGERGKAGVLGPEFSGKQLAEAMSYFEENWWAADVRAARGVLHNAIIDAVSEWGLKAYNIQPGARVERLTSVAKAAQSIAVLGFNPAYKINNDISNTVGMLAEGIFGMASDTTIRRWFDEFGVSPYRLRAGIGAAEIEIAPDVSGRSLTEMGRVEQAYRKGGLAAAESEGVQSVEVKLREARRVEGGAIQGTADVLSKAGRYAIMQHLAAKAERSASERALYYATRQAFSHLWPAMIPDMPRELRQQLDGIDPRIADTLMTVVARGKNPKAMAREVIRALGGQVVKRAVEDYVDDVARTMGIAPADLREVLTTTGVADEINRRIGRGASVTEAFSGAMERTRGWLDAQLQKDLIARASDAQVRVSSEGFVAALDIFKDLQFKLEEVWTRHFAMWEETYRQAADLSGKEYNAMIRARASEARAQWRAYRQWERATTSGVLRALGFGEGKAASHEARLFMKLQKGLHDSWGRFFEETSARYDAYYDRMLAEKWDKKRRMSEWERLQDDLTDLYIEYAARENKYNDLLGYAFVKMFGEQYGPEKSVGAIEWWRSTQTLGVERQELMKSFRKWLRGQYSEVRPDVLGLLKTPETLGLDPRTQKHAAWPLFLRELYLPLIGEGIKGGMDGAYKMMEMEGQPPDVDIVERYNQTLEQLRQSGYKPGQEQPPTPRPPAGPFEPPPVEPTPRQPAPAAPAERVAPPEKSIDMKYALRKLGYSMEEIKWMDPDVAQSYIDTGRLSDAESLKASRNTGLMGPRDGLTDADLPTWFTDELSERMAAWANDLYTTLPFGDDVVTVIKTQTNEDIGGEWEGAYKSTSNPIWYTEWNNERKAAGMPELNKQSVASALQRVMQDQGKDRIRGGEETINRVKRILIEHALTQGDEYFELYDNGYIWSAIDRGDLDEAARIYNDWVTSAEIGPRLTPADLLQLARGEDNLLKVQEHWAGDTWQAALEARQGEARDELMEQAREQFERDNLARPYERTNQEVVQEAVERITDQVLGDKWVERMETEMERAPEPPKPEPIQLEGVKLEEVELDALRTDGREQEEAPPFERAGEMFEAETGSRRLTEAELDMIQGGPLEAERRINVELRQIVEDLKQRLSDAMTDPDTGLPVWKHFKDEVEAAPVKLAVDVQGLKWINDNFGFSSGNALLRTLADTARDQGYDIYRVGGDEFVLTFDTREEALVAISKLKEEFRAAYVPVRTETGEVLYYRGFVIYSGIGETFDSAYRELDYDKKNLKALYEGINPEMVRGGRPSGIKEAARLYNLAVPEERRRMLIDLFRFNNEQADAEMMILQRAAEVWSVRTGMEKELFWHGTVARKGGTGGELPPAAAEIQAEIGGYPRGAMQVLDTTSRMVWALDKADADTWLHESAHLFYSIGDAETRRLIDETFKGNADDFADGYVQWRAFGNAPGPIAQAFEQFRSFIQTVLRRVARVMRIPEWKPGRELDAEMERVYRRLFELEPWEISGPQFAIKPDDPDFGGMTPRQRLDEHPHQVLDALREGKPVSDEIIDAYPGIKTAMAEEIEPGKPTPLDVMAAAGDVPKEPPRRATRKGKPAQAEMFTAGEELPLFSGTAQRGEVEEFRPQEAEVQPGLPGMEPPRLEMAGAKVVEEAPAGPTPEQIKSFQETYKELGWLPPAEGETMPTPEQIAERQRFLEAQEVMRGRPLEEVLPPERVQEMVEQEWAQAEPLEAPVVETMPARWEINQPNTQYWPSSKKVAKLLYALGIENEVFKTEYYRKVVNPPYIDLVIETHPYGDGKTDALYLTHYVEQNGDWMIDTEMVYGIANGSLVPLEYAYRGPWGEVRIPAKGNLGQFDMFARNLLSQGFDKGQLIDPRAEQLVKAQVPREELLTRLILDRLAQGLDWENQRGFEQVATALGFDLRNEADLNLIYDLFEGSLNMWARGVRADMGNADLAERLISMQQLEDRLMQARRTISKTKLQQFSTPLTISEAAMAAADVRAGDTIGEPTAGTANLVDGFYGRNDVAVRVNEIDPGRQAVLRTIGYEPTGLDVLKKDWVIGPDGKPLGAWADVMIINPPWGAYSKGIYGSPVDTPVKGMNDWSQRFTHLIMQRLAQGGRLVIVAPTNWVYTKSRTTSQYSYKRSEYLKWLDNNAYVRAVIESPPGAYDTRATGVGSLLIVIDKVTPALRGASVEAFGEKAPADWRAYAGLVEQVGKRGEADVTTAHTRVVQSERAEPIRPATGPDATGLVDPAARRGDARGDPADIGRPTPTEPTTPTRPTEQLPTGVGRVEPAGEPVGVSGAGTVTAGPATREGAIPGRVGPAPSDVVPVAGEGRGAAPGLVEGQPTIVPERVPEQPRELSQATKEGIERSKSAVASSRNFALYEPRVPLRPTDVANPHPTAVVETKGLSGVAYPKLEEQYRPSDGVMSALRRRAISVEGNLDPVWAAIQQNEKNHSALLVADDVGMGKSRTAAAYVLDRIEKGAKKVLVVTTGKQNVDNLKDVEFPGVWGGEVNDYGGWTRVPEDYIAQRIEISGVNFPEVKRGDADLPTFEEPTVYFIAQNNLAAFADKLDMINFDVVVVDEAHLFKNTDTQKGSAWYQLHDHQWLNGQKPADMLYLTATPGADVMDLQYLYGLRVWSIDGFGDWVKIITGEESADHVRQRQEAQEKVNDYVKQLEALKERVPNYTAITVQRSKYDVPVAAKQVGDYIVIKDTGYTRRGQQPDYEIYKYGGLGANEGTVRVGDIERYSLRSEGEALIVAGIATEENISIDQAYQRYKELLPDMTRNEIQTAGYTDASDVQRRSDSGSWGRNGKRSAWDATLTPAHTENIMRELKLGGYYMARDISRAGVEFNVKEYAPTPVQQTKVNARIDLYRRIIEAFNKYGKFNEGPKKASAMFGVNGDVQGDIKRALFDIRLQGAINEAKAAVARGEKVVISTISVSEVEEGGGRWLENAISKINTHEVRKLGEGQYSDPTEISEALLAVAELREEAAQLEAMASPFDILSMVFGDKIGFVTGAQDPKERSRVNRAFQADELDVVMISGAGKTGINLHDITGKRVHLIVADYEWSPTNFKQELGRVDRTGQKTSPIVTVLHTGTAAERKFVATIANRMKGLGAVSKGEGESTGTAALSEEFEFGSMIDRLSMANTWAQLGPEERFWFLDRYFDDPQTPGMKKSNIPTTSAAIQKFLIAFQSMPREVGNRIYDIYEKEKMRMTDSEAAELDEGARAQRNQGEILRETELQGNLRLTEVRADDGTHYAIVSGVMSPVMNRLRNVIAPEHVQQVLMEGQRAQQWMRWVQFFDASKNQYVSGIVVKKGRIKSVAEAWGKQAGGGYKPETALQDIMAGDKIPLHGPDDAEIKLYMGTGGYRQGMIVVDGAKMAQRDALMRNGAKFDARGTFFYVEPEQLQAFLKRFPIRDVAPPEPPKTLYQWAMPPEKGNGKVPQPTDAAAAASRAVQGPSVMPLPRHLNVEIGGRSWRVVGFVFDGGKFVAYVPERFSNLKSFKVDDQRARVLGFNAKGEWVYTLEDGKYYTQPMEVDERPAAAGPLALGSLEAAGASPTYHSEIQAEGYHNWVLPAMDEIQNRMRADERNPVRASGVDENTLKMAQGWLNQVEQRMPVAKSTALKLGYAKRDAALINYSKRRNIDTYAGMLYPYQFWLTRNAANWAMRQMDRPAWASQMARLAQFMNTYEDDRPSRMKGKFFIPQAFVPEWAGGGVWVDLMSKLFPHSELQRPLDYFLANEDRTERIASGYLRDWAKAGDITTAEADEAIKTKQGPAWERAITMAGQEGGNDWVDYMGLFTSPAMYLTLPYQIATGKFNESSPLPISRLIQGLATATGADWLKNLDVEATLREKLGYSKFGQYGDYYIERQLSNMAIEGRISPEEATRAMITKTGDYYNEALERVEQEQMLKNPMLGTIYAARRAMQGKAGLSDVLSSLMTTALPGSILPQSEMTYYGLADDYNAAWAKFRDTGDKSAVDAFYDAHPEYEARRALYRKDEDRIKYYLINEVWDRYLGLPALQRRQVREQLGGQFQQDFLNKETQNYDALSSEQLAGWARLMGGQGVPGLGEGAMTRPLELAEQGVTDTYQVYADKKAARYPGIDNVMTAYYKADPAAQDAMKKMNPMIDDYLNYRYQYMADNPEMIEYMIGEDSSLAGLKPEVARWMAQYYADRGNMFGSDIFKVQNTYYDLTGTKRKSYLKDNPQLKEYWDWRRQFQAMHPEIIPFVNSTEKIAESWLGKDYQKKYGSFDLEALPKDIQADLFGYSTFGTKMTQGSYSYLRYQWERAGRPMGSFNGWLSALTGR